MKKRLILLLTGTMSLCLAACSPHSDRLDVFDVPPERQNFHWAVASEDAQKVPYSLAGEADGWRILLEVRTATPEEKEFLLQLLDSRRAVTEENYTVHHTLTREQYEAFCEQLRRQEEDISQNDVYASAMIGQYTGETEIYTSSEQLSYQIIAQDGSVVLAGAQDIQSLTTPWYSSYNTVSGEYAPNMFVPPLEGAVCLLQYEDVTIEIPLTLTLG